MDPSGMEVVPSRFDIEAGPPGAQGADKGQRQVRHQQLHIAPDAEDHEDSVDEVDALYPSTQVTLLDWSDTFGALLLGGANPTHHDSIRIYIAFLALACIGGLLVLLSSSHLIPWYYSLLAVVLVTPHMVFDVMLWQRTLAHQLAMHVGLLPTVLNNAFFFALMALLSVNDQSGGAVSTMCLAVTLVAANLCVMFYDAIHPSISKRAVIFALAVLLLEYAVMLLAIYFHFMLVDDVALTFTGSFSVNAKSLVLGCLQNMIVIVVVQLLKRHGSPADLSVLYSRVEVRSMTRTAYNALQEAAGETRRMLVASPTRPHGSRQGSWFAASAKSVAEGV